MVPSVDFILNITVTAAPYVIEKDDNDIHHLQINSVYTNFFVYTKKK